MSRLILLLSLAMTGCMTTPDRVTVNELNEFKPNCKYKQEQLAFLQSQLPTRGERQLNQLTMTSVAGTLNAVADGSYENRQKQLKGYDVAIIHSHMRYLKDFCR